MSIHNRPTVLSAVFYDESGRDGYAMSEQLLHYRATGAMDQMVGYFASYIKAMAIFYARLTSEAIQNAEDFASEGNLALLRSVDLYTADGSEGFQAYLKRRIRETIESTFAQTVAEPPARPLHPRDRVTNARAEETMRLARIDAVAQAIEKLTPRQQQVVRAQFYGDQTLYEIAADLGTTYQSAQQTAASGLRNLQHPAISTHLRGLDS